MGDPRDSDLNQEPGEYSVHEFRRVRYAATEQAQAVRKVIEAAKVWAEQDWTWVAVEECSNLAAAVEALLATEGE